MQFEMFQKYSSPETILSFVLYLLHIVGLDGTRNIWARIRFGSIILFYVFFTVIPQLIGGNPDVHQFVRASVEFLFNCNIFVGSLFFAANVSTFRGFVQELKILAQLTCSLSYNLKHALARFNQRADIFAKIQTTCMAVIALSYWAAPITSIYWFYFRPINSTEPLRLVQHLEVKFYWLENRTILKDYVIFVLIMLPVVCMCSIMCNIKVMSISCSIAYCTMFTRLTVKAVEKMPDITPYDRTSKALFNVVLMHARLLKCIHLLNRTLRSMLLMQWLVCGLNWSISLVYLTNTGISLKSVTVIVMFCLATVETFIYCLLGTRLATQQERLERAVYTKRWYNYSLKVQRNVLTILRQAQKPAHITVGKFFRVNLEEFSRIVNLSYSAYVVLKDKIKMDTN
ncbi:uncharacterized protein LOC128718828 [Anopheles marshallii]|uniref:uncharacterized protein LOC128718828 n=1 Tax=Anopheles marshallii TaxID=1521116 RepID=UPI00237A24B0|nr:uncharacterized protein LOC128718828 [Anopheles marshallii]